MKKRKKQTKHNILDWCLHATFILLYISILFLIFGIKERNTIILIFSVVGIIICVVLEVLILYLNPYKKHKKKKKAGQKMKSSEALTENKNGEG